MAAAARKAVEQADRDELELERTPWSKTGFVNVTKVGGKYQARLQVPGDGRGGIEKRKQCSLPGLFDTAEDAAVLQALVKKSMKERNDGNVFVPPKQNKPHKPRSKPAVPNEASPPPLQPPQLPMATAVVVPSAMFRLDVPFTVVSPLAMRPLRD